MRSPLVSLIVAVAVIGVLLLIVYVFLDSGKAIASDTACTTSVWLRSEVSVDLGLVRADNFLPLVCPTQDIGTLDGNRNEVKGQIAQMASTCWDNYAQGRVRNLFKSDRGERDCGVCYTFKISDVPAGSVPSVEGMFFEESSRESGVIKSEEMYNFMFFNVYQRSVVRGGNLDNYMSGVFDFRYNFGISDPERINTRDVEVTASNLFVNDYADILNEFTIESINTLGQDLLRENRANLHVVIAENFDDINPRRGRQIIENNDINSENRYDALLIMIDLKEQRVLVRMGRELETFVYEHQIPGLIRQAFHTNLEGDNLDDAILTLLDSFRNKMLGDTSAWEDIGLRRGTYMSHLTNYGSMSMPIIEDIQKDRTYVVAYIGETRISFFRSISGWATRFAGGISGRVVPGAFGDITTESTERIATDLESIDNPSILIVEMNNVLDHCNFY